MSHEIRTPMNGVLGMTDAAVRHAARRAEQRECATVVHESAEHLMHVIDDILDFSKIEAGKLHVESVPFDAARDVLEQALAIVAPAATRQGLALRADAPRVPLPPPARRSAPAAPGADQPARQRGQVHQARRRHAAAVRPRDRATARQRCASR